MKIKIGWFAFILSFIPSLWAILIYEFNLNQLSCPCGYHEGWNEFAKNISYSILGGWILFLLTSILPNRVDYNKYQIIIKEQLLQLNVEFSDFIKHTNTQGQVINMINVSIGHDHKEELVASSCICCILKDLNWESDYSKSNNITYKKQLTAIVDKIESTLSMLSLQYGKYFSENQLKCINVILEIPLKNNWAVDKLGDVSKREDLINLALQIGYPLQKSIGISTTNDFQ